jgi:hypothetical protein
VSTKKIPFLSREAASRQPTRRARWWHRALFALGVVFIAAGAATARLFIWPDQGMSAG